MGAQRRRPQGLGLRAVRPLLADAGVARALLSQMKGVNLSCVRTCMVVAEERPRIALTQSFSKLFRDLGLPARAVSTTFGCRVNVAICLQVRRRGFLWEPVHTLCCPILWSLLPSSLLHFLNMALRTEHFPLKEILFLMNKGLFGKSASCFRKVTITERNL